jgi:YVTN family beta-propeller protein
MARTAFVTASFLALALACPAAAQHRLLVLNKSDHTMSIVDPAAMKVVGTIPVGRGPHEVVTSADGKTAFVANYGDQLPNNSISIVDIAAMKEVKRVDLGRLARPHGMVENGGKVYFTSEAARSVARYDPAADKVDWTAETGQTGTHMLAVSKDGTRIYTANIGSDTVSVIHAPPGDGTWHVQVGRAPEAIDLSPDGREVWVGQNGDGHITIIDTATRTVKEKLKVGEMPIRVKFTPDGRRVVVSDPRANAVVVLDAASRKELKRLEVFGTVIGIQMAPDGKRAYIARAQAGRVDALDLEKLEFVGSVETGKGPDGLAYAVAGS